MISIEIVDVDYSIKHLDLLNALLLTILDYRLRHGIGLVLGKPECVALVDSSVIYKKRALWLACIAIGRVLMVWCSSSIDTNYRGCHLLCRVLLLYR